MQGFATSPLTQESFEQIFHRYEREAMRHRLLLRPRQRGRSGYCKRMLCRNLGSPPEYRNNPEAYLYQCVRNECLKYRRNQTTQKSRLRKNSRQRALRHGLLHAHDRLATPTNSSAPKSWRSVASRSIKCPELRRRIFTANKFEGLSYKEIADKTGSQHTASIMNCAWP